MPRSKEDNEKIRIERMSEIKNAAIRVYALKGYLGTQMDDIAKEAGLAKGLLYYYFKSKTELFKFVFKELMDRAFKSTELMLSEENSLRHSLESFIQAFLSASFERPMYPLVYRMMPRDLIHVFPEKATEMEQQFFNRFTRPVIERFSSAMDKGEIPRGNPMLQALHFTNGVLAMSHLIASNPDIANGEEQLIEEAKQLILYGIFKRDS